MLDKCNVWITQPKNHARFSSYNALSEISFLLDMGYVRGSSYKDGTLVCSCENRYNQSCFYKTRTINAWTPIAGWQNV